MQRYFVYEPHLGLHGVYTKLTACKLSIRMQRVYRYRSGLKSKRHPPSINFPGRSDPEYVLSCSNTALSSTIPWEASGETSPSNPSTTAGSFDLRVKLRYIEMPKRENVSASHKGPGSNASHLINLTGIYNSQYIFMHNFSSFTEWVYTG